MAVFYGQNVLDKGLEYIGANCNELRLLSAYSVGDTYATVVTNTVCLVAMVPGDYTIGNQGTNGRETIVSAKAGTASSDSGATPDLHVALTYSAGTEVVVVTDETSDQEITNGNPVNFPSWRAKMNQPTLV